MASPSDPHRVSVIHSRPSVICPPQTEASYYTYHTLTTKKKDLDKEVLGPPLVDSPLGNYDELRDHYTPYPQSHNGYYHNSVSSNCSDNSANSFQDWSETPNQNIPKPGPSESPPGKVEEFPQKEISRKRGKRERKTSFLEGEVFEKKIKLEGSVELKEKVGNKPISNCKVCGDLAVAHMHYGGVCCYSCKAFFRRATQTGKDKKYKCKSEEICEITYKNRRSCQYCRFQKCLEIGMKPNWVLSDEQCNIRFRNVRKDAGTKDKPNVDGDKNRDSPDVTLVKEETCEVDKGLLMPFTLEEGKALEYLVDCYNLSKETYSFSEENDLLWNKLFNPSPSTPKASKYNYSTFDLGNLIMTVIKKNIFFVKRNSKFGEMTFHDQKLFLQKNMSEMCHIRGAIRFDSKSNNFVWYFSKKDQLQMSFERQDSAGAKETRMSNALIGDKDMSKFYTSTTSQSIFALVNKLCGIGLPMEVFLIMIYIVLFSSDNLILDEPIQAEHAQNYYMLLLHRYLNELFGRDDARMKLSRIMGVLVDLRELCERSKEEELARIKMQPSENHCQ